MELVSSFAPSSQGYSLETTYTANTWVRDKSLVLNHANRPQAHEEYSILPNADGLSKIEKSYNLPWSVYVGVAGMPGKSSTYVTIFCVFLWLFLLRFNCFCRMA